MKTIIFFILFISGSLLGQSVVPNTYRASEKELHKAFSDAPSGNSIFHIITNSDTILINTGLGLSRSVDKGESWTNFFNLTSLDNERVSSVACSNGNIWAAFTTSVEQFGESVDAGNGLRFSTDKGITWNSLPQPIDSPEDTLIIYGHNKLEVIPFTKIVENIIYDIALINNTVLIASWKGGLRRSTDMGKTWQKVVLPPDNLDQIKPQDTLNFSISTQNLNQYVFSIAVQDSLTFYVGTAGGINKTTDGGISWRKFNHLNQTKPISGNFITSLKYNPLTKILYAASWKAQGSSEFYAVSFTTDGGNSWTTTLDGEKVHGFGFKDQDVIAATDNGAFRSSNMGKTWILPGQITDRTSGISIKTKKYYSATSQGNDVWLGSEFGLIKLTEKGSMWNGDWEIFMASVPLDSKSSAYVFPNPFSPDVEKINIKYSTNGQKANVTIRIFDFGMNLVKTVIQNAERGNSYSVIDYWDGKNERGDIVPNGVYFYRIDLGQDKPVFGKIMVLM